MPLSRFWSAILVVGAVVEAFVAPSTTRCHPSVSSSSSLSALPPMIISGMLKKMREDKEKQSMPMAEASEAAGQAPGLRVGENAWKWPPVWPYDASFFLPSTEAAAKEKESQLKTMTNMLTGVSQVATESDLEAAESLKFDPIQYWTEEHAEDKTEMDQESIQKLKEHYAYYLKDGMSILEFGAAENSYLPDNIKPSRHVGVGLSTQLMKQNPSLTDSMVVDLNKIIEDRDVDSDELRRLASEPFDAIIMSNTIDFLTGPREVLRTGWYLLKPGGMMMVSFSGKEATKDKFPEAQTKMWQDYNDDQHMWITGSFFQFSAGDGWESLRGFDISPDSAKKSDDENPLTSFMSKGKGNNLYIVQATKGFQDDCIDRDNLERSIRSLTWMLPNLEDRDKQLVVPRLVRACELSESNDVIPTIERNIQHLPAIYDALVNMDQFAFTFSMQSQMAADLICNSDFTGSEEQILNLKQGLGLRTPSPEFWAPVGENTAALSVEDKINLLAYIVPCFGSSDPAQEEALQAFVSGLKPTYAVIRSKCPDLDESDVQLLGTELLAAEVLKPGQSSRDEFATWLAALSDTELRELLAERKSIREDAGADLQAFKKAREEQKKEREENRRLMEEQIQAAREERSLIFNPKTEKMEVFKP